MLTKKMFSMGNSVENDLVWSRKQRGLNLFRVDHRRSFLDDTILSSK
jgi:hypothetical protein